MFCFKLSLSHEAFCIFSCKVQVFRARCVSWQWNHCITELGCVLSRPPKFIFGISASGSPFQILMICLPFDADFKYFCFPGRPGVQDVRQNTQESNGIATVVLLSLAMRFSAFRSRHQHFSIQTQQAARSISIFYAESKHFARGMLMFRCEISVSLEAFECSASN